VFELSPKDWFTTKTAWSKEYRSDRWRVIERDLLPALGAIPLTDLSTAEALAALQRIEARGAIEKPARRAP
jgi:hypothetical protein